MIDQTSASGKDVPFSDAVVCSMQGDARETLLLCVKPTGDVRPLLAVRPVSSYLA